MKKNLDDLPYGAEFLCFNDTRYRKVNVIDRRVPKGCWGELLNGSNIIAYFGENWGEVEWLNPPKVSVIDIPVGGKFKFMGDEYTRLSPPRCAPLPPPNCEACVVNNRLSWFNHDHEVEPL